MSHAFVRWRNALIAMKSGPGVYEVARYPFRRDVIEISYRDRLPKKYVRS